MAFMTTKMCTSCGETYTGNGQEYDSVCGDCQAAEDKAAKSAHFAELDKLTLEERIRRLEDLQYEHSKIRHGYIPPPTF